jgi:hypothetical protein
VNLPAELCFAATLVISLITGVRLVWVARRTHAFPESALGSASLVLTLAGASEALTATAHSQRASWLLLNCSHSAYSAAAALSFLATQRIFREQSGLARFSARCGALCLGGIALSMAVIGPHVTRDGLLAPGLAGTAYMVGLGFRLCAYGWLAVESLAAHRAGLRAVRFGLADPLAVHQLLLWSMSASAMGVGVLGALYTRATRGEAVISTPAGLYFFSVLSALGAGAAWLAFFPPAAYARHIERQGSERDG